MSRASALRVEKVSVRSPCCTTGVPSSDNCNWLIVCSYCPQDDKRQKRFCPIPHPPSHMRRDHGLALQATLLVEPAHKRHPLVFRTGLVIGPSLIEHFDSEQASDLLARKTHVLEIPNLCHGWDLLL